MQYNLLFNLCEREEDIAVLSTLFLDEAKKIFGKNDFVLPKDFTPDVSENVLEITENYLLNRLGGNNDYRSFLHLFEVPLIRAGIKRFKSQLQLSDRLGLNRNTLRKKIAEHSAYNLEFKE